MAISFFFISLILTKKSLTLRIDMAALSTDKVTNLMYAPWIPLEGGLAIQYFAFVYKCY
jgi:hypothetical protein